MKYPRIVSLLGAVALAAGCAGRHTLLEAPDPHADASARLAAYGELAPAGQLDTVVVKGKTVASHTADYLVLGNGARVHHADDLLPVVDADSPTARAAVRSRRARHTSRKWAAAGGVILAGAGYFLVSAMTHDQPEVGDTGFRGTPDRTWRDLTIGLGLSLASLIPIGVAIYYSEVEADERVSAFATYEKSLRERLSLCTDGLEIVDCGQKAGHTR